MPLKKETKPVPVSTSRQIRRRVTMIEVLVALAVVVVLARLLYHIIYWRDVVKAVSQATAFEIIIGIAAGFAFIVFRRRLENL